MHVPPSTEPHHHTFTLTRTIISLQAEHMADDVDIDFDKMRLWTEEEANSYFESGGAEEPLPMRPPPQLLPASKEELKKWFPKSFDAQLNPVYQQPPRFRMVRPSPLFFSPSLPSTLRRAHQLRLL